MGSFLILMQRVYVTHPVLASFCFCFVCFLSGRFLWHIPSWFVLFFNRWTFCYTSPSGFIVISGVFLTYPVLALIWSADFLLPIPCRFHFYRGTFSYTSRAGFIIISGVSLIHHLLKSFSSWEFLLHVPCWLYFCCGEFPLQIPCWLLFILQGVSLAHPVLA